MNVTNYLDYINALIPELQQTVHQLRSSRVTSEQELLLHSLLPIMKLLTDKNEKSFPANQRRTPTSTSTPPSKFELFDIDQSVIVGLACLYHTGNRSKLDPESERLVETVQVNAIVKFKSDQRKILLHVVSLDVFIWLNERQFQAFAWHKPLSRGIFLTDADLSDMKRSPNKADQRKYSLLVSLFRQSPCFDPRAEDFLRNNMEIKRKRDVPAETNHLERDEDDEFDRKRRHSREHDHDENDDDRSTSSAGSATHPSNNGRVLYLS